MNEQYIANCNKIRQRLHNYLKKNPQGMKELAKSIGISVNALGSFMNALGTRAFMRTMYRIEGFLDLHGE